MQSKELVIQKLQEVRDEIPGMKERGVSFRKEAKLTEWQDKGVKWLKLGLPNTTDELSKFKALYFVIIRTRARRYDYDKEDEQKYQRDCDRATSLLNSAIENLQMELVAEPPKKETTQKRGRERPQYGVGRAETVIMGEGNVVNIVDTITISDFLNVLEKEIEAKVTDAEQKKGLLQKLKELSENPAANTVMGQALGTFLKGYFGG